MVDLAALTAANAARWNKMRILAGRAIEVEKVAGRLCAPKAKAIYQDVARATWGAPDRWWFVAIVHEREAGQDFSRSIAQGDPWNEVSRHVPRGIGPFAGFVDAAVFTLRRLPPHPAQWQDWSIGGVLTLFELYNGLGYEQYHHEPSPYDWGATTIEQEGKYVADGLFNPQVWDSQIGCAALLKAMSAIDSGIKIG